MPTVDYPALLRLSRDFLTALGEDPDREGLRETPRRMADSWREFIEYDAGNVQTAFESIQADQMVIVKGMRVWSMCEHHLLPFWCDISIGYITTDRVLGLSKFARIAHKYAHRLQVQERLVDQIATEVKALAQTQHVAVLAEGEHLCMSMRGIKTPAHMVSSAMYGAFRAEHEVRAEFLALVKG
jgi:GTP cyclohydrolase I